MTIKRTVFCIPVVLLGVVLGLGSCDSPAGGSSGSYTVGVRIVNIPPSLAAAGAEVDIVVSEATSELMSVANGGIVGTISGTEFVSTIKERTITVPETVGTTDKRYEGSVTLSFDVYIDVDGNGEFDDTGDRADAISWQDIVFDGEDVLEIDYTGLHAVE